jgi:hypothetical protein
MRRYDIAFGILLTLSITDFALAAPVLVQEKGQALVGVVRIPEDVITVLRKRGSVDDLAKLAEQYLNVDGRPIVSSDTHASPSSGSASSSSGSASSSSGSAPSGTDHVSTDEAQAPPSDPASSIANPDLSIEPTVPPRIHSLSPPWSDDDLGPGSGYSSDEYGPTKDWPIPYPNPKYPVPFKFPSTHPWASPAPAPARAPAVEASTPNLYSTYNLPVDTSAAPQTWPHSPLMDGFVPPWSDDESLGSGSGYSSMNEQTSTPKPDPNPNPASSTERKLP